MAGACPNCGQENSATAKFCSECGASLAVSETQGRKVVTINSEEGAAYGVALLAAVGAGEYKDIAEACAATIRVVSETAPPEI